MYKDVKEYWKEHLRKNILKIQAGRQTNRKLRNGAFKHTLELRIVVRTGNLWENARKYIWRNLGQDMWTRKDGSTLTLDRIHVKF